MNKELRNFLVAATLIISALFIGAHLSSKLGEVKAEKQKETRRQYEATHPETETELSAVQNARLDALCVKEKTKTLTPNEILELKELRTLFLQKRDVRDARKKAQKEAAEEAEQLYWKARVQQRKEAEQRVYIIPQ